MDIAKPAAPVAAGWNVAAGFVCILFIFGVPTMMMPMLYSPILDEFSGWSRAQLTGVVTVKFLAGSLCTLCYGFVLDRWGIRIGMTLAGVVVGLAMLSFLWVDSLGTFYLAGGALGIGSLAVMMTTKVLVSRAYNRRQGVAVGVAMLGTSVAGSFTPSVVDWLVRAYGWREAVAWMSLGVWLVAIPFFLWKARDVPRVARATAAQTSEDPGTALSFDEVVRSRAFWCLAIGVMAIGFVDQALTQHVALYLERELRWDRAFVAHALGLIALISLGGKVGFGWVMDRFSVSGVVMCYLLAAVSVGLAYFCADPAWLLVFVIVRGLAHGGSIVDVPVLAKHVFGPKVLGRTIGMLTTFIVLGFAAGPFVVGWLYDDRGSYRPGFHLMLGLCLLAAVAISGVRPAYWLGQKAIRKMAPLK